MSSYSFKNLKNDVRASVVVFLVALPLAMGIAIASGYPPVAGLITGIIGGILVGILSGAPFQVSGAAAGLTVVVYQGVQTFGLENMGLALFLAGIMQMIAAYMGFARFIQAVSSTVLHAMLAGIGILIVASQFHVMLDLTPQGSGLNNIISIPESLKQIFSSNSSVLAAGGLGFLAIAIMMLWPKDRFKILPAPLLAVIACSLIAYLTNLPVNYVKIPDDLFTNWKFASFNFSLLSEKPEIILYALQVALIASAESLLCAAAVDHMHEGPRAQYNRELGAQGFGNALCGFLGALPMTGVIVRSSANVSSGAVSRLSTIFHGMWLLLFVVFFPYLLSFIPIASLAGVLVYVGIKLVNIKDIKRIASFGRSEISIYMITVAVVVTYNLLFGVLLGIGLSSLMHFRLWRKREENKGEPVLLENR